MNRRLLKSREHVPLLFLIVAFMLLGLVLFNHVSLTHQPPFWDALDYMHKAKNFWDSVGHFKLFNPLNLEPTLRPPGTVLMSYPFGFSEDPHGFFFRSLFIPLVLFVSGLWIVGSLTCSSPTDRWLLASMCLAFTTLPLFYHLEPNPHFRSATILGLVDNLIAGMAALATALISRGVTRVSGSLTLFGIVTSAFCLLIKPAGALVMAVIFFVWAICTMAQFRSLQGRLAGNEKTRRYIIVSLSGYIVIYGLVTLLSFGSKYLSSSNIAYGKRAIELLQREWFVRDWWHLLKVQIHTAFGWHWILFILALCGLSVWIQYKRSDKGLRKGHQNTGTVDLMCTAIVLLTGIWFWIIATEQSQIRYFFPFALMCITLCFPRITSTCIAIPDRFKKVVCALLVCPFALLVLLLISHNAPVPLQEVLGVNLTVGTLKNEVKQAESLIELARHEKRNLIVYFMSLDHKGGMFAGMGAHARILNPNAHSFLNKCPVDWVRGSNFRFSDIVSCDYLVFEPIYDPAVRSWTLSWSNVPDFWYEKQLIETWLTGAGMEAGLKTESETSLRLVKVVDKLRLEDFLMRLGNTYQWRQAFLDANPVKWIDHDRVGTITARNNTEVRDVRFGEQFMLMGLSTEQRVDGLKMDIVWRSLKEQQLKYTVFVHLVDAKGAILAQADYDQDAAKRFVPKGTRWRDIVEIPANKLVGAKAIGLGIYLPPDGFLVADYWPIDWNGRRLLIKLK